MNSKEFDAAMKRVKYENQQKIYKEKLKTAKYKGKKKQRIPTSKKVLWAAVLIIIDCLAFAQWSMVRSGDYSSLYVLLGIPAALIPTVLGYFWHSSRDHRGPNGEGITWQNMMNEQQNHYGNNYENYPPTDDGSVG